MGKLEELEKRVAALVERNSFVTVTFSDGSTREMRVQDVIDLMHIGGQIHVVDIAGDVGAENGHLMSLLIGMIYE